MSDDNSPLPSASMLLLRDTPAGIEVFMIVRHHKIDAFAGALVFPGGKLDPGDSRPDLHTFCRGAEELSDTELAFRAAAIRETFEECGVLLARVKGRDAIIDGEHLAALENYRRRLIGDEIDLYDLCRNEHLELALDLLVYYAHWITPMALPKRFDTHFFLAPAPADQLAIHDGGESLDSVWIKPQDVLVEAEAGTRTVVFATRMMLRKLGHSDTVSAALETARTDTVVTVLPDMEPHERGRIMTIPADAGYGLSRALLDKDGGMEVLD